MKKTLLFLFFIVASFLNLTAQLTESFDGVIFPPAGWTNTMVGGGTDVWRRSTNATNTLPTTTPHSGAGMALYDAYNFLAGESADLATPVLNFTSGAYQLKFWMFRDSRYSASNDSLEIFINNAAPTGTGATKLGAIWRHYLDAPAQAATGWYEYTFAIPGTFNTATNYIIFRGNSDYGTEILIDDVSVTPSVACSGTPTAGTSSASVPFLCTVGNSTLSLTGASIGSDITYAWESSPAGANIFTPIIGANASSYSATVAVSTDFKCKVTCTNGGGFTYSNISTVTVSTGPPANDAVCGAITLTQGGGYDCSFTNCATSAGDPTLFCSTPNNTVWYKYTATANGSVDIRLKRNGGTSGQLNAWVQFYAATGACPTLTLTEVNATACVGNADLPVVDSATLASPTLTSGVDYYIMVEGFSGSVGAYCIQIIAPPPPPACIANISPADGATGVASPDAPIVWTASPSATSYDVYFGTVNPPTVNIGNIAAPATTVNITGLQFNTTYYWYVVPKNGNTSGVGCAVNTTSFTTTNPPANCIPDYTTGCSFDDYIQLFRLKGETSELNISGTDCNVDSYVDTTDHTVVVDLARGKSYWGQMLAGTTGDYITAWLDANDNGLYENSERLINNLLIGSVVPTQFNLFIPLTTATGNHTLRVRNVYYGTPPTVPTTACGTYTYGETEDYRVNIISGGSSYTVSSYIPTGTCYDSASLTIDAASNNNGNYVPLVDSSNNVIAQIYPQGNDLKRVNFSYYKHNGAVRQDPNGRYYMDRNITIKAEQSPLTSYNLRYFFLNTELNALIAQPGSGVTSVFDLMMTKTVESCVNAINNSGPLFPPTGFGSINGDRFIDVTNILGLSSFYLHGGSTPLSVGLLNFIAKRNGKVNNLSWTTSQETNSSHFSIERSNDGINFITIGRVNAAGTSLSSRAYNFTDKTPVKGINYYRLRLVDIDNSAKYSAVRSIRNEGSADISIFPNPVKDVLKVNIVSDNADKGIITIADISGKLVYSTITGVVAGENTLPINTSILTKGAYLLKIQLSNDVIVKKFNKL